MAMLWRHHKPAPALEPTFETLEIPETSLPAVAAAIEESLTETEDTGEEAE